MPWYDWYQTDLPCQYSQAEAAKAREYLQAILGSEFIAQQGAIRTTHPLLKEWDTNGGNAFLQLNGLADDVRLLCDKPGIDKVLTDIREEQLCLPSWHLLHTAALFERARRGSVVEFLEGGDAERPDAIVDVAGSRLPLEAKLLTQSEDEERFGHTAQLIDDGVSTSHAGLKLPTALYVILKQFDASSAAVIGVVKESITDYRGISLSRRCNLCNVFLSSIDAPSGLADFRIFYVLAPVPDSENIRVLGRAKKASNQLRSLVSGALSGILSIGLNDNQDGAAVFDHIADRIRAGRFRGISGVLLVKRRTQLGPPQRVNVDLLEFRSNSSADQPLDSSVPLRPAGAAELLTRVEPPVGGIRAYRFGSSTGRVIDPKAVALPLPDVRILTSDDLK